MNLEDLVSPATVACNVEVGSKKKALEYLSELLESRAGTGNSLEIFQQLTEREKLGSTGLGHGVALPHARTGSSDNAIGAFIKLKDPVNFESPDGQPADLLFALIVPEHSTDEHLKVLAGLAKMFSDEAACNNFRNANTSNELYKYLTTSNIISQAS